MTKKVFIQTVKSIVTFWDGVSTTHLANTIRSYDSVLAKMLDDHAVGERRIHEYCRAKLEK